MMDLPSRNEELTMKYGSIIVIQWGYNGDIMEHIARRCPKKANKK